MIDKDGLFLDNLEEVLHDAWMEGEVTNEFRNKMVETIQELRDWL